jgi:hypothetical protein
VVSLLLPSQLVAVIPRTKVMYNVSFLNLINVQICIWMTLDVYNLRLDLFIELHNDTG